MDDEAELVSSGRSVALAHYAAFNARDLIAYGHLLDDAVEVEVEDHVLVGRDAVLAYVAGVLEAFPTMQLVCERVLAEGPGMVVTEMRLSNTAVSTSAAPPAASEAWELRGPTQQVIETVDGRIRSIRSVYRPDQSDWSAAPQLPSRVETVRIREDQAALRRVATLVARGEPELEVFSAAAEELGRLVGAEGSALVRFEHDDTATALVVSGEVELLPPVGVRQPLDAVALTVCESGQSARLPQGRVGLAIGVPILVAGRTWGMSLVVATRADSLGPDAEARMTGLTDLAAIALRNARARAELERAADEQSALRRVAELVAGGASPAEVFTSVVEQASRLLDVSFTTLLRFEPDGSTVIVALDGAPAGVEVGLRSDGGGDGAVQRLWRTGSAARIDDLSEMSGQWPRVAVASGYTSSAAVPILIQGQLWGTLVVTGRRGPLPANTEQRLTQFADLASTAVAAADARTELRVLADEQAALRRLAELVARGVEPQTVLDAVVAEASRILGDAGMALMRYEPEGVAVVVAVCRSPAPLGMTHSTEGQDGIAEVLRTGRTYRTANFGGTPLEDQARELGVVAGLMVPITVEGRVWGNLSTSSAEGPIPPGVEARLIQFADLAGLAVSNAQARKEVRGVADEQAALRRVAELVARGVSPDELFASVAEEASRLIDDEATTLLRFEEDGATVVAICGGPAPVGARMRISPDDESTPGQVLRTGRVARRDHYPSDDVPEYARKFQVGSSVAAPIKVEDRVWGLLGVTTSGRRLPVAAELRLQQFTELVSAALANSNARAEVRRLADEQAALRRVAELVARGVPPEKVFATVAVEASRLLGDLPMTLVRIEDNGDCVVLAERSGPVPVGGSFQTYAARLVSGLRQTGWPAGLDAASAASAAGADGNVLPIGAPIAVDGQLWGLLVATSAGDPLPAGIEHRLAQFGDLVAAGVSNAENRAQLIASRARVLATADETRRRVQRDVHDGAQQRLVQTVLTLKMATSMLEEQPHPVSELVDDSLRHAERATRQLRDLVDGILPAPLTRGGLRSGIDSIVADLPLAVTVEVTVPRLPEAVETTAFFLVSEALTNVVKHADATRVSVFAGLRGEILTVAVSDDGRGGADPEAGSGLTGLYDRVAAANGTLTITSPIGEGTTISVELGVASDDDQLLAGSTAR